MEAFSRSLPVMTGNPSEGMRRLPGTLAGTVPPGRPALAADYTAAQAACRSRLVRRDGRMGTGGAGRVRRRRTQKECAAVLRSRLSPGEPFGQRSGPAGQRPKRLPAGRELLQLVPVLRARHRVTGEADAYAAMQRCWKQAAQLSDPPFEPARIPYGRT